MPVVKCEKCGKKNRVDLQLAASQQARCGNCGATLDPAQVTRAEETKPLYVTDATFEKEVLQSSLPVLVDCWAEWCGPCRMIAPVMDQLAAEAEGRYRIAKLNVDENRRVASQYRIQSIPTLLIFKDGQMIDRLIGAQPKQAIESRLQVAARAAGKAH